MTTIYAQQEFETALLELKRWSRALDDAAVMKHQYPATYQIVCVEFSNAARRCNNAIAAMYPDRHGVSL